MQAGSAKDKAYRTGQNTVDSASATGKQAYDATKEAAEDLSATLKSYVSWAQSKASELTKSSKDTTNVSIGYVALGDSFTLPCTKQLPSTDHLPDAPLARSQLWKQH